MDQDELQADFLRFAAAHLAGSHAQLAQDLWVLWLLGDQPGWFVEIGGFDGVTLSNTLLHEQQGWTGLLVEPLPEHYSALVKARSCATLNCAIGREPEDHTAFRHVPDAPELSRLENVVPDDLHEAADSRQEHELIETHTITIAKALQLANAPAVIDYISLDTEGNELEILQSFPFDEYEVRSLTVEHNQSQPRQAEIEELLAGHGFVPVFPTVSRWDGWYTRPETLLAARSTTAELRPDVDGPPPTALAREAQIHLGHSMFDGGLDDEAASVASIVHATVPGNITLHRLLVGLAERSEDPERVGETNEALSAIAPQLPMPAIRAAAWRRSRNEPEQALAILDRCTSPHAAVSANRGNLLIRLERPAQALDAFDLALGSNPPLPLAVLGRADALRRVGRPAEALVHLRANAALVSSLPSFPRLLLNCTIGARADATAPFVLPEPAPDDFAGRTDLAQVGAQAIPEPATVDGAGLVNSESDGRWQRMFNRVDVPADGYYGQWMTDLIGQCAGRHEPQEEHVFAKVLEHVGRSSTMIELGAYWSFYSTWFSMHLGHDAELIVVEPDADNLPVARQTLERNGATANVVHGRSGPVEGDIARLAEAGQEIAPQVTVADLMAEAGWTHLTVLHADIQGAEIHLAEEIKPLLNAGAIDFLFVSTHGRPHHVAMLRTVMSCGYELIAEHSMAESFSCDGLIVAQRPGIDGPGYINIAVR